MSSTQARKDMKDRLKEVDDTMPGSDTVRTPWWFDTSSRLAFWRSYNIQEDDIEDDTEDILVAAFTTERVITQPTHPLSDFDPWLKRDGTVEFQLVLDSGASMHVVGDKRILREVNLFKVPSWATLPDNSQLRVVGIGVIEMGGFRIPNVSLVEGLRKNLISVSQLDRDHGLCSCFRERMCEVMTAGGTVVGGAILEDDNLYVLRYLQVPKPDDTDP
uniref:Retrovirus-related Pol polyprotein from transposon TNT 1-94-like beta-barrel domain-containing protein n=1 Tax=Oryza punctata TaxID=4537 RepID=A0A0E0MI60_ORYPU